MFAEPVIYDGDPGSDDALAIMAMLGVPDRLRVLGITTVFGNVALQDTTRNALAVLELCRRRDIKVYAGYDRPLVRRPRSRDYAFGESGLGSKIAFAVEPKNVRTYKVLLPTPKLASQTQGAVDFIVSTVMAAEPQTVTLIATGPLTNIAMAFNRAPDIEQRLKQLVIMGGGYKVRGNITPDAEFNFFMDPEAAARVLATDAAIRLVSLDTVAPMVATKIVLTRFTQFPGVFRRVIPALMTAAEELDRRKQGTNGAVQCDPVTICYLLRPDLFEVRPALGVVRYGEQKGAGMLTLRTWLEPGERTNLQHVSSPRSSDQAFSSIYDAISSSAMAATLK